jgi:hypothetical protein
MIQTIYLVTPHDTVNQVSILRQIDDSGRLVVTGKYSDLVCKTCHKVDEKAALARGVQNSIVITSKRSFILSSDFFYIVSHRIQQLLGSITDLIDFIPIPATNFFIASPRLRVEPIEIDPGFRFGGARCVECRRPREVVWGKVPPRLCDAAQVSSVNLEGQLGARAVWLVSEEVANGLKKVKSQITGMVIRPKEIDDGRLVE